MRLIDRIIERRIMKQQRDENNTVLGPFRVLDLTDEKGMMCGWILASLGAEVIKVEPPCGDKARNIPPFFKDQAHPEKSLFYFAYNANKKSITLNIETADGRAILKKLVKVSDFIIESFEPGYMDKLGIGYKDLSAINPRIVMTAISPFGQTGPYSMFKSSDLLCSGMSGFMYLTGEADSAPMRVSVPQAYSLGSTEASVASVIAHYYRQQTGEGQFVDVAIRDAMLKTTINALPWWEHYGKILKRSGPFWTPRGDAVKVLWKCKDGWVSYALHGGKFGAKTNKQIIDWLDTEGMATDYLKGIEWEKLDMENVPPDLKQNYEDAVVKFFIAHLSPGTPSGCSGQGHYVFPGKHY